MTGAMYASIAGLKTHMQKLSVIGNNVANVNTNGYKTQRTVFRDAVYSTYSGGSNGSVNVGGKNPSEIGYGSQIGSIDMDMSSATINPGNPGDLAIIGDGFFLVGDKTVADVIDPRSPDSFKSLTLTRVGDFSFKADGYYSDGQGKTVYGFMCLGTDPDGNPIVSDQLVAIRKPRIEKIYLNAAGDIIYPVDNADGNNPGGDLAGPPEPGTGDDQYATTSYRVRYPIATEVGGGDGNNAGGGDANGSVATRLQDAGWDPALEDSTLEYAELEAISVDEKTGQITATVSQTTEQIIIGYIAMGRVDNPNGVSHEGSSYYSCGPGAGDLRVHMMGGAAKEVYNAANCQPTGGASGIAEGRWTSTGAIKGLDYVNGSLYQTANDDNTQEFSELAAVGSGGGTYLRTGFLEAPNVDLATEISELITTQRGYQANTRIITVTDSMLEELVNMKR